MNSIFPEKLKSGDKVMVVSPSDSLANISPVVEEIAFGRLKELGLEVVFAKNARENDEFFSSSIEARVDDLHQAFSDKSVKGIFTSFGGYNCNQLLRYLDFNLIKNNPKVFLGFSDTTVLQNAIFAKTGMVTYSSPSFSRFGQKLYFDYTLDYFKKIILATEISAKNKTVVLKPSEFWSDDYWFKNQEERILEKNSGWKIINEGKAKGVIIGGNLSSINLLQGTEYFPSLKNTVLFVEDDEESKLGNFDRDLQSLLHLPDFDQVQALLIGRFQKNSQIKIEQLTKALKAKKELTNMPVIADVDFGHTDPIFTFPIGEEAEIMVSKAEGIKLEITKF